MPGSQRVTGETMPGRTAQRIGTGTLGFEVFAYPAVAAAPMPSWEAFANLATADCAGAVTGEMSGSDGDEGERLARETRLAEEVRRGFEAGRERGALEGRAAEREALAANGKASDAGRIGQVIRYLETFNLERARYFEAVEPEVVRLALVVAARILRREAQMDPLLLSGAVRVALGQLSASTQVRLRVPSADLELWSDTIAHLPNLAVKPAVVGDEEMRLGECVLETELGSVNLGVAAQLAEIERGFFDRTGRVPVVAKATEFREDMSE